MKKLLISSLILFYLLGCAQTSDEEDNKINYTYDIISKNVDMSGYDGVNSTQHSFRGIVVTEFFNCVDNESSGIFYLGRTNCACCQTCISYLDKTARELGVTIYYMDVYDEEMPITDKEVMDKLRTYMDSILIANEEGEKELQTPTVFSVINGKLVDSLICLGSMNFDNPPTEYQENRLINRYKEILKPFADQSQD